jgi:hypothetical protein
MMGLSWFDLVINSQLIEKPISPSWLLAEDRQQVASGMLNFRLSSPYTDHSFPQFRGYEDGCNMFVDGLVNVEC